MPRGGRGRQHLEKVKTMKAEIFGIGGAVALATTGLIIIGVLTYLNRPLYMSTPGLIWGAVVVVWAVVSATFFRTARKRNGG